MIHKSLAFINSITHKTLGVLLVDPAPRLDHLPILADEGLTVIVLDVRVKKVVKDREIVKRDHGIGMMLAMEVCLP